jgi:hypothetical protein
MRRHERAQFAPYGVMRLVTLRDPGASLRRLPPDEGGRPGVHVEHPSATPSDLYIEPSGRLAYLTRRVPAPDGPGEIARRFDFEGTLEGDGVRWPRALRITHGGRPHFELTLERFRAGPKAPPPRAE